MEYPENIEKCDDKNEEEFGMGSVGEVKKHVPNKVEEVEGISNSVTIE